MLKLNKEADRVAVISDLLMFSCSSALITSLQQGSITPSAPSKPVVYHWEMRRDLTDSTNDLVVLGLQELFEDGRDNHNVC